MTYSSVAVLVDGDNISSRYAEVIFETAKKLGSVSVCRVYVDSGHLKDWESVLDFRLLLSGTGKNSTDILMCVDAMELSRGEYLTHFVIASGDRDFRHLAHRLRELGRTVVGIGPSHADERYRRACSAFQELSDGISPIGAERPEPDDKRIAETLEKVKKTISTHGKGHKRMTLSQLGKWMIQNHQIAKTDLPTPTWKNFLANYSDSFLVGENDVELVENMS